jgi:hypothetical protein
MLKVCGGQGLSKSVRLSQDWPLVQYLPKHWASNLSTRMGILNVTLFGLFVLARLVLHVKTVQLLPVAISGKPAVGWVCGGVRAQNSRNFAVNLANEGTL